MGKIKEQSLVFWLLVILTATVAVFLLATNAHAVDKKCESFSGYYLIRFSDGDNFKVEVAGASEGSKLTLTPVKIKKWEGEKTKYTIIAGADIITQTSHLTSDEANTNFCKNFTRCPSTSVIAPRDVLLCNEEDGSGIWYILNLILQILTWGVGIVAVLGIVIAAIIYITAGGDAGKTKLAKTIIFNIVIGVILYFLLYAILNFILPNQISSGGAGNKNPL